MKKKFFIPWIIAWLFFIGSFCSSQFVDFITSSWIIECTTSNKNCWVISSPSCYWVYSVNISSNDWSPFMLEYWNHALPSVSSQSLTLNCWVNVFVKWPYDSKPSSDFNVNYNLSYESVSSSMPVSSLSPVVNWLRNTILEFIPYIVYVWIWILSALIWFVAIKRLINRLRNKTLSPFK